MFSGSSRQFDAAERAEQRIYSGSPALVILETRPLLERLVMSENGLQLPETTRIRLVEFQKRVRVIKVAEGILAGAFGLLASYLVVFVIDRFIDTSALVRP